MGEGEGGERGEGGEEDEEEEDQTVGERTRLYRLEGVNISDQLVTSNISVWCGGGEWCGEGCGEVWWLWQFWGYTALLHSGTIAFKTAISINDAIAVDTIGPDGDYGSQRVWGTFGWGLMGPLSGCLIDWCSGTSLIKDYTPAFLVCFVLGITDVLLAASTIKVPKMKTNIGQLKSVLPLLQQPRFLVFCAFVVLNGAFNIIAATLVLIMQKDMAEGTWYMSHIKLIQGLTLFVQCGTEAPFMAVTNWFLRRLGAHHVTSLVFGLYVVRMLGHGAAGAYNWPLWTTLVVEMLNGPCYGLGFTATVVYSSRISPPGASTTVQSLTNLCYESFGFALGMFGGGLIYSWLGGPWLYLVGAVVAALTFVLHLISQRVMPPEGEETKKQSYGSSWEEETEKLKTEVEEGLLTGGGEEVKEKA